jgi:septum formation protein
MIDFYLASHSARRVELLRQIGARFQTLLLRYARPRGPDVTEDPLPGEDAIEYAARVAHDKARRGVEAVLARRLPRRPVLAADTVVVVDGAILGKPLNVDESARCLLTLSGRSHEVVTAVTLAQPDGPQTRLWAEVSRSIVTLRAVDPDEARRYAATGEPFDKAGGYAIQGRAAVFVTRLEGSYSGVVGLPLAETAALLAQAGIRLF